MTGASIDDIPVVLDTNAYRRMCTVSQISDPSKEVVKYMERFKSHRIVAFANPYVIMELAAHLADPMDPDFSECRQALCAQHHLCSVPDHGKIRILADSESQVLWVLYKKRLRESDHRTQQLCAVSLRIHDRASGALDTEAIAACKQIKSCLDKIKAQFISDMWKHVVLGLNPSSTGWEPLKNDKCERRKVLKWLDSPAFLLAIAKAYVLKAMKQAGVGESEAKIAANAELVKSRFSAPLQLYAEILKRIVKTGCNMGKDGRSNWVCDMMIILGIGVQIQGIKKEFHLVTSDRDMLRAAKQVGSGAYVHSLQDFAMAIGVK